MKYKVSSTNVLKGFKRLKDINEKPFLSLGESITEYLTKCIMLSSKLCNIPTRECNYVESDILYDRPFAADDLNYSRWFG